MIPSRLKLKLLSKEEVRKNKTSKTCNECNPSSLEAVGQKRSSINGQLKTSPKFEFWGHGSI